MNNYAAPKKGLWTGREASQILYWHQYVQCVNLYTEEAQGGIALLGYAVDEGVARNKGRVGAVDGPDAIKTQLAKLALHIEGLPIYDVGNIQCRDALLEVAHHSLSKHLRQLLEQNCFPILLGGGHDIAYAHYKGIKSYVGAGKSVGIINLDAHFDLRKPEGSRNSGTPFYQIATEAKAGDFNYLCLGIQKAANNKELYQTAAELGVQYMEMDDFHMGNWEAIAKTVADFSQQVDHIYLTLDMDGFSSAYAPGVSAPSALGFEPQLIFKLLEQLVNSKQLISVDLAELNPVYDIDNATSRLAAGCIEHISRLYSNLR
jgi:formiminoglutamase